MCPFGSTSYVQKGVGLFFFVVQLQMNAAVGTGKQYIDKVIHRNS